MSGRYPKPIKLKHPEREPWYQQFSKAHQAILTCSQGQNPTTLMKTEGLGLEKPNLGLKGKYHHPLSHGPQAGPKKPVGI